MFQSELISIRDILIFELMLLILLSDRQTAVRAELRKIWQSISASLDKKSPKKQNKFREIDLTRLEP